MNIRTFLIFSIVSALAACGTPAPSGSGSSSTGSAGSSGGYLPGDGPGDTDPRLSNVPDAVPKNEPLHRFANRPYDALGVHYVPQTSPGHYRERGIASWYGKKFHGQRTSSGEVYDMYAMSAAHKTLPIPSYARVTNLSNGKSVIVRVNDRGPFVRGRLIDLSYVAASKLDIIASGHAEVEVVSMLPGRDAPAPQQVPDNTVQVQPLQPSLPPPSPLPVTPSPAAQPQPAAPAAVSGTIFLQLGSFRSPSGAQEFLERMRNKLYGVHERLSLYSRGGLTRVHLGPYRTEDAARASADQLAPRLGFKPFVSRH